jgi:hypothetical protein
MLLLLALLLIPSEASNSTAAKVVSGPWYYIADGLDTSHPYNTTPSWMNDAGNWISLAFMNPKDLGGSNDPVPAAFKTAASYFISKGKTVFFSIGGAAYGGNWNWLSDSSAASKVGSQCADIANQYKVGIEIDYEGGGDPLPGMKSFISAFRAKCPMGNANCLLTTDLYGSPGGAGWQKNYVSALLPPSGVPGQTYGNGQYIDYVNVMVIDGQPVSIAETFWQQWLDTGVITTGRSTWGLIAGFTDTLGICYGDATSNASIDQAVRFFSSYHVYGFTSWAVCPPVPGNTESCADWDPKCNDNAPGFKYLCTQVGSCT